MNFLDLRKESPRKVAQYLDYIYHLKLYQASQVIHENNIYLPILDLCLSKKDGYTRKILSLQRKASFDVLFLLCVTLRVDNTDIPRKSFVEDFNSHHKIIKTRILNKNYS